VDFLLHVVLIELFARSNRIPIENRVLAPTGSVWPKISGRRGRPPPTILLVRKLWMNDLLCGLDLGLFPFVTKHAFDRQTDRQTDGRTDGRQKEGLDVDNTVHCIAVVGLR